LISRLRRLGFEGPYAGGSHEFMLGGVRRLILPNPHRAEIGLIYWCASSVKRGLLASNGSAGVALEADQPTVRDCGRAW
jgi:hypothetical protein